MLQLELTSITTHFSLPGAERRPLPTVCPQTTLDKVGRRWTIILQWGLSQPSARTPTETIASISPSSCCCSNLMRSAIGVLAVTIATTMPALSIFSKVASATVTSGQNQAEIGLGETFFLSSS